MEDLGRLPSADKSSDKSSSREQFLSAVDGVEESINSEIKHKLLTDLVKLMTENIDELDKEIDGLEEELEEEEEN